MKRTRHIYSIILMVLFLAMISFMMMNDLLHFYKPPKVLTMEKRNISEKPVFDVNKLDPYPAAYTKFNDDNFPYRVKLIDFYAGVICLKMFHRSPYPKKVELGKDGWMYFGSEGKIYQGTYMLSDGQIKKIVSEIHNRAVYYHDKGIKFYLAIPPIKQEIYPEYLPLSYNKLPGPTVTDKILDLIKKDTLVKFVDVKSALLNAKKAGRLYYKTDNHWNALGGYYGYRAVIDRMKQDFPSLQPLEPTDFTLEKKVVKGKNMAENMSVTDYINDDELVPHLKVIRAKAGKPKGYKPRPKFPYPGEFEIVKKVDNVNLPLVVIIRDSYFYGIMPYMVENFRKTVILYDTYTYGIFDDAIQTEKPELVFYMIYEPHLPNLIGIILW
jgi:hypothetical protein